MTKIDNAKLVIKKSDGNTAEYDLAVHKASLGSDVIDVAKLSKDVIYTFDPGFRATASCESKITFIDGAKGLLLHRGYPIEELANKSSYLEVCFLLLNARLPKKEELTNFEQEIAKHSTIDEETIKLFQGFSKDAHPMAMLSSLIFALAAKYHKSTDITKQEDRQLAAIRLIAKVPTLSAMAYRHMQSKDFIQPKEEFSFTENFLNMCFGSQDSNEKPKETIVKALDTIFTLHADHEQNASTSTVRLVGSSGANPYACIAAGVASLWGPAHGGANEAVLKMLNKIEHPDNISKFIEEVKDKNSSTKLMGFGHRVYKNFDPRANIMREHCHKLLDELNINSQLLDIAMKLEEIALNDEYFLSRKLYPNIDFYSGIVLQAIGIPVDMFTVIFALARTSGWATQWCEMQSGDSSINRPRQLYTGNRQLSYPTENR